MQYDILMVESIFLLSVTYLLRLSCLYTLVGTSRESLCIIILQVAAFELKVRHHHSMFCMLDLNRATLLFGKRLTSDILIHLR